MKTSILGSGVYGKAMSNILLEAGNDVTMWTEKEDFKEVLARPEKHLTNSFEEASSNMDMIFVLTGSKFVRPVLEGIAPYVSPTTLIILGSKGILDDGTFMTDLAEEILPNNSYAVISGPTFAVDIAALEPVGFTIGTKKTSDFEKVKTALKTVYLEHSEDVQAIEMAGSLKNAYAIGSGILSGFNFGNSTRCLYITKVIHEMANIFTSFGCQKSSTTTLAGIGDLVLTCMSANSRNFTFGTILSLESDENKKEYLKTNTVEGYENLKAYTKLFKEKSIDAPILSCVADIVDSKYEANKLIELLLEK